MLSCTGGEITLQEVINGVNANETDLTDHEGDLLNPHEVTQANVGLGNVNNTSDLNKPISTATQTVLDNKANSSQVLTDVPAGALFTDSDTVYDDSTIQSEVDLNTAKETNIDHPLVEKAVPSNAEFTDTVYTHPTYTSRNESGDTGAMTGATVISDLDFNLSSDTTGHVTSCDITRLSTRQLTASDIGAQPSGSYDNYSSWNYKVDSNSTESITSGDTLNFVSSTAINLSKGTDTVNIAVDLGTSSTQAAYGDHTHDDTGYEITSGSNSNGSWVKYPDGTLICWKEDSYLNYFNAADVKTSAVFAASFIDTNYATTATFAFIPAPSGDYANSKEVILKVEPSSGDVVIITAWTYSLWSSEDNITVNYVTIGRWK